MRTVLGQLDKTFLDRLRAQACEKSLVKGETLCTAESTFDGAYLVTEGRLGEPGHSEELHPGDMVDEIQLLTGGQRSRTLIALEDTRLLLIRPDQFRMLVATQEQVLERLSSLVSDQLRDQQLTRILSRLFGELNDDVQQEIKQKIVWLELEPAQTLFHQSDPGDALYAVIDGRLAAFSETDKDPLFLNEILPGETIGEISIITGDDRSATVKATSRSLLVRLARSDFDRIVEHHPIVYKTFAQVLVTWLRRSNDHRYAIHDAREVTLIAHRHHPQLMLEITQGLEAGLGLIGPVLCLSSAGLKELGIKYLFDVDKALKKPLYDPQNTRFRLWLEEQKRHYSFIIYETDGDASIWDRLCLERAHELLIVAQTETEVTPGELELLSRKQEMTSSRLVLIHPAEGDPANTDRWLVNRSLSGHHHLRLNRPADYERLARFIAGKAIGLVLAGGGAKGFAHIGIIRALHECGIPIDLIGGTSTGGIVSLSYGMDTDPAILETRNQKEWIARKPLSRYALPILSILDHTKWDQIFRDAFQHKKIEDLWIPAFSVSCNLDTGEMVVHDSGIAWKAVRATSSLPVFLVPVLFEGHGHVDGGVINNMPTDVMRKMTSGPVFAINLGNNVAKRLELENYPSPWRLALEKFPGFRKKHAYHTVPKVIMQLATMQDQAAYDERSQLADFMLLPPVAGYSMTDIKFADEIVERGYAYGIERLREWIADEAFREKLRSAGVKMPELQPGFRS